MIFHSQYIPNLHDLQQKIVLSIQSTRSQSTSHHSSHKIQLMRCKTIRPISKSDFQKDCQQEFFATIAKF